MSATNSTTPCAQGGTPSPSGDCTPEQHRALQDEVNSACKSGKRACNLQQDCATLLENIGKNQRCADARAAVNNTCFKGGDSGHNIALTDALTATAKCTGFYNTKCRPQPVPEPEPAKVPEEDSGFMKKMAAITGLSGAALLTYVIISEGSRLFPPRNLIPVP